MDINPPKDSEKTSTEGSYSRPVYDVNSLRLGQESTDSIPRPEIFWLHNSVAVLL
jgi:hypothetical protein